MSDKPGLFEGVAQVFRDHGLTAALTALIGGSLALAAAVTRKAFTNEALLHRLDRALALERERVEDRKADADRLDRTETDIRDMRDLMLEAFQRGRTD